MADETPSTPAIPSAADVYDIGIPDLEPEATPLSAAPEARPAQRDSPPQDPVTGKFVSPASVPVQHPRYLVRQAKELGFTPEDISEMNTEALGERVHAEQRWQAENQRQQATRQVVEQRAPAPSGQNQADSAPLPEAIDWGRDENDRPMSEADYAPAVAASVKKTAALEKRIAQLESMVQQITGREIERETNTVFDRMDNAFQGMADLKHLLGEGGRFDLDKDSAEMQRRIAVLEVAKRMAGGTQATNEQILKKLQPAAKSLFGTIAAPKTKPPEEEAEVQRWNDAAVARPTHRQSTERPLSKKAAIEAVTQAVKERNGDLTGQANGVADDDFPD